MSKTRRTITVLCGSTRFYEEYQRANYAETMAGRVVLSVGHYPNARRKYRYDGSGEEVEVGPHGETVGCTPEQKKELDALHLDKIDMADEILVLNCGGYVGESTSREVNYALSTGKPVRWLDPTKVPAAWQSGLHNGVTLPDQFWKVADRSVGYQTYPEWWKGDAAPEADEPVVLTAAPPPLPFRSWDDQVHFRGESITLRELRAKVGDDEFVRLIDQLELTGWWEPLDDPDYGKTGGRPTRTEVMMALAQGYCTPANEKKVLDPDLIEAMADRVMAMLGD